VCGGRGIGGSKYDPPMAIFMKIPIYKFATNIKSLQLVLVRI
jgi:hypothetical protein